jgi:flagellar hook assembly protein FlgD
VSIYDATGRLVRSLIDEKLDAGEHVRTWDGRDDTGRAAGAGIFWAQLRTRDGYCSNKRMLVLR